MGATLTGAGATFRVWAPAARSVAVRGSFSGWDDRPLVRIADGHWFTFIPGVRDGDQYKFHVVGNGSNGEKRDPYAREIALEPPWPHSNCTIRPSTALGPGPADEFPWHDGGFRPPAFHDLVLYQLHVGAFYATDAHGADVRRERPGRFLDLLFRLEYLAELGVNAVQLLPIQEFSSTRSLGYNGTDYFSPEMDYCVRAVGSGASGGIVSVANRLLTARGQAPFAPAALHAQIDQLKAIVDLFHVYGIAVIFDVVYNHAGGDFGDESIYFLDRQPVGDNNRSLYFTDQGWAGGLVFAFWKGEVRQFLIDNARLPGREYHVDGFRFDEVTVIDRNGGWGFLQDLTGHAAFREAGRAAHRRVLGRSAAVVRSRADGGAGFDAVVASGLRGAVREVISQAARGASGPVDFDARRRAAAARSWRRLALRAAPREPRRRAREQRDRSRAARRRARRRLESAVLVRPQPEPRRQRPAAHGAGHPDAVHGAGNPRGQILERQSGFLRRHADLVGRPGVAIAPCAIICASCVS